MPVELTIDGYGERKFTGRIGRINPSTEPGTRAVLVYVALPNREATLRTGMFGTGRIALAAAGRVPTLPSSAVRTDGGQTYVWGIVDNKLVRRTVLLGRRDEEAGRVEVKTSLPADLPILVAKFDNLKEGAPALVRTDADKPRSGDEASRAPPPKRAAS
jgi:multidrug efflux pump subunit AcrA (membrane-fusion protein)